MTSSTDQQPAKPAPGTAAAFGTALKAQRNRTRRSLEAVAHRVGLSTSTLSRYERGECLPSEEHLTTICDALEISSQQRLHLVGELTQARANHSVARQKKSPPRRYRPRMGGDAIRRHWRIAAGLIVVAVALVSVAATVGYLTAGRQADPGPGHAGSHAAPSVSANPQLAPVPADCDSYTVAAADLYRRDFDGGPIDQLPRGEVLTVIERLHPRGLPYWKVTTKTNQEGWVDFRHLRPACG